MVAVFIPECTVDADMLVVRPDGDLFKVYLFALVDGESESRDVYFRSCLFYLSGGFLSSSQFRLNSFLFLLKVELLDP